MDFNTSNVQSYFSNASASDCRTFASDITSNGWTSAWGSRFALTARQTNGLNGVASYKRSHFIDDLNALASAKDVSATIDYSGFDISNIGTGDVPSNASWTIHTDWAISYPPFVITLASFWIDHKTTS